MDSGPPHTPDQDLMQALADALSTLRDAWMAMSLALSDLLTDCASAQRDQTLEDVRRYLDAIQDNVKRDGGTLQQIPKHFPGNVE